MVLNRNVSLFPDVYVSGAVLVLGGCKLEDEGGLVDTYVFSLF